MSEANGALSPAEIEYKIQQLKALESVLSSRRELAYQHGLAFGGKRDYVEVLGYKPVITPQDYYGRFKRQSIARRAVTIFPKETWRIPPKIWEDETEADTPFEKSIKEMEKRLRVNRQFYRADVLACMHHFSVLYVGFDDTPEISGLSREVQRADGRRVNFLMPFDERYVEIVEVETGTVSPRFGLPLIYEIDLDRGLAENNARVAREQRLLGKVPIHWSRIIHFADELIEDDIYGTPKLEAVFDLLDDLMKVVGGGAEMFWRSARKDLITEINSDANFSEADLALIKDSVEEWIHDINKSLVLGNAQAKSLAPAVASPKEHVEVIVALLASAIGVPQRKIWGSERGELASSQDENNFYAEVQARQVEYATDRLRDYYDRCINYGVLPQPAGGPDGYTIEWEPLIVEDENEKADYALKMTQALKNVSDSAMLGSFPIEEIRTDIFKWDPEPAYELDETLDARESVGDDGADVENLPEVEV
jgi:hypothetical protein